MADDVLRQKQFAYSSNANLVLQAERDKNRAREPTGEAESLVGRVSLHEMGDRAFRSKPTELKEKVERARKKRTRREQEEAPEGKRRRGGVFLAGQDADVLTETTAMDAQAYRPKSAATRHVWERLLAKTARYLGDVADDTLRGAAEEILATLKDEDVKAPDKHRELRGLLQVKVSDEEFNEFMKMSQAIFDFAPDDAGAAAAGGDVDGDGAAKLDEEAGVAVVFDDDEEEEDEEDSDLDVIVEPGREEGEEGEEGGSAGKLARGAANGEEGDEEEGDGAGRGAGRGALSAQDVDAFWLQRQLSKFVDDATESQRLAEEVLRHLVEATEGVSAAAAEGSADRAADAERACENSLVMLLDYDKFEFIKLVLRNRARIAYCTQLGQAQTDEERARVRARMEGDASGEGRAVLEELGKTSSAADWSRERAAAFAGAARREARKLERMGGGGGGGAAAAAGEEGGVDEEEEAEAAAAAAAAAGTAGSRLRPTEVVNLEALRFREEGRTMTNRQCTLPEGSWRAQKKGYEEVHVPAQKAGGGGGARRPVGELPEWTRAAFEGMESLNRVQTQLCEAALFSGENLLLCAPTGAGKTNVAVLTMLHEIGKHRREDGSYDLSRFKIVYVAPMKALVQEVVANLGRRLREYGISVRELSGDVQLTKAQIAETQVIVTTPEKWDIVTRKAGERAYTQLVRLVIVDEIHLLHDSRGPVLESLVARTLRQIETTQEMVRLVGLSATLPNYEDVAAFLRVKPDRGLFFFDNTFRPCPLQQQYIGLTEKKPLRRFQRMNEICYDKLMQSAGAHQVLIFVHSRKETAKTARALRDLALENDTIGQFLRDDSARREVLQSEAETAKSEDLRDLLPYGFAVHHAGMVRADRTLVEDLFADGHVQVLVSTATLAWGVNLPAHTVIIKGTQIYSPEKGAWVELSPQDMMQMLGRAGRPQYDTHGEGIIITGHGELQFYLSLMNQQLPIESQLISRLADQLNAEVVLGTVQNLREAVDWLGYTYLYVRMLRSPELYGVSPAELAADATLQQRRANLVHSAALLLDKNGLVRYDRRAGVFQVTALGRVAAHFYVSHETMRTYNEHLKPTMGEIEILRLFSLSQEFANVVVRSEEKLELQSLVTKVPVPVKESVEEPTAKVNVLLQAYISRLSLDGFAMAADMVYVQQSAGRLLRALFEISLKRGWAALAERMLALCKMVDRRMWASQSPLRQFPGVPEVVVRKLEKKELEWERYADLKPADLGEMVRLPRMGPTLHRLVRQFPRVDLAAHVLPITPSLLKVELTVVPAFEFDPAVHGWGEAFHVWVEDVDGERVLYHQLFLLKGARAAEEHVLEFTVPLHSPMPPQYFVRVVSDRWLQSDATLPLSFRHLLLPAKYAPPTELLDLQPLPASALGDRRYAALYPAIDRFNPIQTQAFAAAYEGDGNLLLCAPCGSGRTVIGEFAILRMLNRAPKGRCVFVAPSQDTVDKRFRNWNLRFGPRGLGLGVAKLSGEAAADLKLLEHAQVVLATAAQWDVLSRRWKKRPLVQRVDLFLVDNVHLVGGADGPTLEVVCSRMRYISSQLEDHTVRIVALGAPIANARDVGEWLGAGTGSRLLNFHPNTRPLPLEIHIRGFDVPNFGARMLAMAKPVYGALRNHAEGRPALVFVPSRRQAQLTAIDILTFAGAAGEPDFFRGKPGSYERAKGVRATARAGAGGMEEEEEEEEDDDDTQDVTKAAEEAERLLAAARDPALRQTLAAGVAFLHGGMSEADRRAVRRLYLLGVVRALVVTTELCWATDLHAHTVVVMGTDHYDGREQRYVDYPVAEVLEMVGRAARPLVDEAGKVVLLCSASKKDYYKRFLHEPLPVESHLDHVLADHFNAEVVTRTIENKQDAVDYLTWTLFYRRLAKNPNYYGLQGTSHAHLSDFLSELVEQTLADLEESRCVAVEDEMDVAPGNLGMIAAHYYVKYTTVELFASSLTARTKLRGLLNILAAASEFATLPVRHQEMRALQRIAKHLPHRIDNKDAPNFKANCLLQAHFARAALPVEHQQDQARVVGDCVQLVHAIVDVVSSSGWLKPALAAMELSQMCVQALWDRDPPLLQVPHFTRDLVKSLAAEGVETVADVMDMEDDKRARLLPLPPAKMNDVARFCNQYPDVDISFEVQDPGAITTGDAVTVAVKLERDMDEEDAAGGPGLGVVVAPHYPKRKIENWWVVVGDTANNAMLAIKRVSLRKSATTKLVFEAPEAEGEYTFSLYLMCDSYLGVDQEYEIDIKVQEGDEDEDDEDEGDDQSSSGDAPPDSGLEVDNDDRIAQE